MDQSPFDPNAKIVVSSSNGPLMSFYPTYELSVYQLREFIRVAFELSGIGSSGLDVLDGAYFSIKMIRTIPMFSASLKSLVDTIELSMNDPEISITNDMKIILPDPTKKEISGSMIKDGKPHVYFIIIYPSPSRLILQSKRPIINNIESSNDTKFSVEIYNPLLHAKLYHTYKKRIIEENNKLTHPKKLISPIRDITEVGLNTLFIAMKDNEMIGYAMFSLALLPFQNIEKLNRLFNDSKGNHTNHFFSGVTPRNLFIIDSLSVSNAYNGYDVSAVLIHHGLSYLEQHLLKYNVTHVVSFSASAATKHILVDRMGFNYFGRNVFVDDDFVDTLDEKSLSGMRHFLRSVVDLFLETVPLIENHIPVGLFHIIIITYQMCVLLNMRYHGILSLLLTLQKYTNAAGLDINLEENILVNYYAANINLFLRVFNRDYILVNWRREPALYMPPIIQSNGFSIQIGLPAPSHNDANESYSISFGYDQLLIIYAYLTLNYDVSRLPKIGEIFNTHILSDINRLIDGSDNHYMMNFHQLKNINNLSELGQLVIYGLHNTKLAETNIMENRSNIKDITSSSIYHIDTIDTITPIKIPLTGEFANLYANGLTKNFNSREKISDAKDSAVIKLDDVEAATEYMIEEVIEYISEVLMLEPFTQSYTRIYKDFTLLELTEYYDAFKTIYKYKTSGWKNY